MSDKDKFYQHYFGWVHGAGRKPMDSKRMNHSDGEMRKIYTDAYSSGQQAAREKSVEFQRLYGVELSVIRTQET